MSQLQAGCPPASVTALADTLAAAGHRREAAEFVNFAHGYDDLTYDERLVLIDAVLATESSDVPAAATNRALAAAGP